MAHPPPEEKVAARSANVTPTAGVYAHKRLNIIDRKAKLRVAWINEAIGEPQLAAVVLLERVLAHKLIAITSIPKVLIRSILPLNGCFLFNIFLELLHLPELLLLLVNNFLLLSDEVYFEVVRQLLDFFLLN